MHRTATDRLDPASRALNAYRAGQHPTEGREFAIVGLVADLLRLAERHGVAAHDVLAKAERHHQAEMVRQRLGA